MVHVHKINVNTKISHKRRVNLRVYVLYWDIDNTPKRCEGTPGTRVFGRLPNILRRIYDIKSRLSVLELGYKNTTD